MKEKREKKKINYLRILWISGVYIILLIILYLVIIYKVEYEGR
jgi:hypothetical protein